MIKQVRALQMPEDFDSNQHAPGSWPNGTFVVKTFCEEGDLNVIGAQAEVIGSIAISEEGRDLVAGIFGQRPEFGYFVEWSDLPGRVAFILDYKLSAVKTVDVHLN